MAQTMISLNPLKSGLCFGPPHRHLCCVVFFVSIPSNRGYVSDYTEQYNAMLAVLGLNPLKSGLCFGPCFATGIS